ncbi:MAG: DUF1638 domain-containing protein [Treponema sp.]|jgi:hypothetical protein|nr:DUF1638 domain-containing protein [Treponema sp.]
MKVSLLSCGIFRFELEYLLPEITAALGDISVEFLSPALDVKADLLEKSVRAYLESRPQDKTVLLYGSMCHTEWARITGKSAVVYPKAANCVELLVSPEKKKLSDACGNVYYLTMGGLKLWKDIYLQGHGWDETDARINFGSFEQILVLDTGVFPISDEELFEFFEFTRVPVERMPISLDYFKSLVLELCTAAAAAEIPGT